MKRPWKNRLLIKFFLSYLGVFLPIAVLFFLYSGSVVRDFYLSFLSGRMEREARLLTRLLPAHPQGASLDQLLGGLAGELGVRLTIIDLEGKVLGDSHESSATMENHRGRPEVVEALSRGEGRSTRYSTTVNSELLYQAVLQPDAQRIIRVSVPLTAIQQTVGSLHRAIALGLFLASGLGVALALFFSRRLGGRVAHMVELSQRLAQGSLEHESLMISENDELGILEKNLNEMSREIRKTIRDIVAEKEKVESILKCMIEGVVVIDMRGTVILINENAYRMFNSLSVSDIQGASLVELSRHPEMTKLMKEIPAFDFSAGAFTKELPLDHEKWLRVSAVSLKSGDNQPNGYILVFHDITELKRLETVRADFVANVSHELRTPVTAIRGYAETLLHAPPAENKDAANFLEIIHRHSERLGRLIDDLLALSDLESGKVQIVKESLKVSELIGRVLEIFRDQAKKRNIDLSQNVGNGLPPILGDSDRLQQLLINLIDNALKYTPPGGQVRVGAALASSVNHRPTMLELSVADTGCGIPQKDLPRLTERFYRVDKARSRELGGTGLGLTIVKHIVQAHSGHLKIESQVQKGTTVRVTLPAEYGATA